RKWEWTDKRYCEGRLRPVVAERKLDINIDLLDLLKKSSDDHSSIVRRISAEILIRELNNIGPLARKFAEKFAADKSHAVSERGDFALQKLAEAERTNAS